MPCKNFTGSKPTKEASTLINSVSSKPLTKAKKELLIKVNQHNLNGGQGAKKPIEKQTLFEPELKYFLPSDPQLERLRKLTTQLVENKMLKELKVDAIKANYNQVGEIKIELTKIP